MQAHSYAPTLPALPLIAGHNVRNAPGIRELFRTSPRRVEIDACEKPKTDAKIVDKTIEEDLHVKVPLVNSMS